MSVSTQLAAPAASELTALERAGGSWEPELRDLENHPITFQVADTRELREQAYRLIYQVYLGCGYLRPNASGMRITAHDRLPETVTFVACLRDTVISSVTLVPDGVLGLPMDEIYRAEVQSLRGAGRRVAEATGLADRRRHPLRGLPVFLKLSRMMVHHARALGIDDLLITANPRHESFYRQCLQFEPFGPRRTYPSVENHPALGFRLNLREVERQQLTNPRAYARYFGEQSKSQVVPKPSSYLPAGGLVSAGGLAGVAGAPCGGAAGTSIGDGGVGGVSIGDGGASGVSLGEGVGGAGADGVIGIG